VPVRPDGRDRLGLDEFEPAVYPLEGMTDPDRGGREVDVAPGQSQDLALAKPDTERDQEQGFVSVALDGREEDADLLGREWLDP
jgi:hypothetical protein